MIRSEPTEELLSQYFSEPGIEGNDIDFKFKEITESSDQRRKLVKILSAFANGGGGTVIIGAGFKRGEPQIQNFDREVEVKRDLSNTARDNTTPPLIPELLNFHFDEIELVGKYVLRIDISPAKNELVKDTSNGSSQPYIRVGDTTRKMKPVEIEEFYQQKRSVKQQTASQKESLYRTLDFPFSERRSRITTTSYQFSSSYAVSVNTGEYNIVPGSIIDLDYIGRTSIYELATGAQIKRSDSIRKLINAAERNMGINTDGGFNYTVVEKNYQWTSNSTERLIRDIERLDQISKRAQTSIQGNSPTSFGPKLAHKMRLFAYAESRYGPFWIYLQKVRRNHRTPIWDGTCGIVLDNILFDDKPVREFFDQIGSKPFEYRQQTGIRNVRFRGSSYRLQNVRPLEHSEEMGELFVQADNPFYGREDAVQNQVDDPTARHLAKSICAVDRLPYQIAGGSPGFEQEKHFTFKSMDMLLLDSPLPRAVLVHPMCSGHIEGASVNIQEVD